MNKKILFLIFLSVLLLPFLVQAQTAGSILNNIKTIAVGVGTPLVAIGFIIAGLLYISAAAAPERMALAKKALIAAVIGTILVALAANACPMVNTLFGLNGSCDGGGAGGPGSGGGIDASRITGDEIGSAAAYQAVTGGSPTSDTNEILQQSQTWNSMSESQRNNMINSRFGSVASFVVVQTANVATMNAWLGK